MTRYRLAVAVASLSIAVLGLSAVSAWSQAAAPQAPASPAPTAGQAPAAPAGEGQRQGRGGRGRGPVVPPPPPLTCSSKATEYDNVVPPALAAAGFVSLFNGKDLTGWQALIDLGNNTLKPGAGLNPADVAHLTPAERAAKQQESNDVYLKHWSVVDGILIFDGIEADRATGEKGGQNLQSIKVYDDVELYVDLCVETPSDSGIYLKNAPQIQMWFNPLGSGGLYNNQQGGRNPLQVADAGHDKWNTFRVIMRDDDMTTVWLNGKLVVNNVKYENYWDRTKPLPARGNIELQYHGDKLWWKNIFVKELN
jgi:hypothetical protein